MGGHSVVHLGHQHVLLFFYICRGGHTVKNPGLNTQASFPDPGETYIFSGVPAAVSPQTYIFWRDRADSTMKLDQFLWMQALGMHCICYLDRTQLGLMQLRLSRNPRKAVSSYQIICKTFRLLGSSHFGNWLIHPGYV